MKKHIILFASLLFSAALANAQTLKTPSASPSTTIKQDFALSNIELSYSRPSVKGRNIFGDLVPYGKVWRTGANSATTISFGEEVSINGTKVKAGKYGILTIPEAGEWTIIITKQLDVTSPAAYKAEQDVVRVKVPVTSLPFSVENFTIMIGNIASGSCEVWFIWDNTMVALPISADVESQVMQQIDRVMNNDNRPYFSAAMYYLDNNKDLNIALEWFNQGLLGTVQKSRLPCKTGKEAGSHSHC